MNAGRRTLQALAVAALLAACQCPPAPRDVRREDVEALLAAQTDAWNRGDLEGFVAGYWRDAGLTFVGESGLVRGFDGLGERYARAYPDAAHRGTLRFTIVEVRAAGPGEALVIGRYDLARPTLGDAAGMFTLLVAQRPEGLRIVHDHSSALAPPK